MCNTSPMLSDVQTNLKRSRPTTRSWAKRSVACAINRSRELKEMLHATGTEPYISWKLLIIPLLPVRSGRSRLVHVRRFFPPDAETLPLLLHVQNVSVKVGDLSWACVQQVKIIT